MCSHATKMLATVRAADRAECMFTDGDAVVVAVSGGADSVALLHLLSRYAPERRLRLHAAHLDHGLRPDSPTDAAVAAEAARRLGVPLTSDRRSVAALAPLLHRGLEHAARMARYAFLADVAQRVGARAVAVGHTADDLAETVMLNILRGSGVNGLGAMQPVSVLPVGGEPRVRLVRPMIRARRSDVRAYAGASGLTWREDPSNLDRRYRRNRVREEVLPYLEAASPGVSGALVRLARAAAADAALLDELAAARLAAMVLPTGPDQAALRLDGWSTLEVALQRRVLRLLYARVAGGAADLGWVHVEAMRAMAERCRDGAPVHLPRGLEAASEGGTMFVRLRGGTEDAGPGGGCQVAGGASAPLAVPGQTELAGWAIEARLAESFGDGLWPDDPWSARLDPDSPVLSRSPLRVRHRQPGDRMAPAGMGGRHRKLQDIFVDGRVPRAARETWPIVDGPGGIVWLPGYRVADGAAAGPRQVGVLLLSARPPVGVVPVGRDGGVPRPAR